jgi:hypothetical protein
LLSSVGTLKEVTVYIKFGWGKNLDNKSLKYVASDFSASFSSSEEYGVGLGNCLPSQLNVTLEVEARYDQKPATEIFKFSKEQHSVARTDGAGKIVVYPEIDIEQIIQVVEFDNAWIANMSTGASIHDKAFTVQLTIMAANVTISDVKFEDKRRAQIVTASKG